MVSNMLINDRILSNYMSDPLTNDIVKSNLYNSTAYERDWWNKSSFEARHNLVKNLDFRDIHAFGGQSAIVLSAGADARMYKTTDGGKNWNLVYSNQEEGVFFDGFDLFAIDQPTYYQPFRP